MWEKDLTYGYKLECNTRSIITRQELNGFRLDMTKHKELMKFLDIQQAEIRDKIDVIIPPEQFEMKTRSYWIVVVPPTIYDPEPQLFTFPTKTGAKAAGFSESEIRPGPWKVKTVRFNPGSRAQIAEFLTNKYKWKPTVFTENGNPSLSEEVMEDMDYPEAELFCDYLTLQKRMSQVESWLQFMVGDRVHGSVYTVGTATYRMSHKDPNVSQVTAKRKKIWI